MVRRVSKTFQLNFIVLFINIFLWSRGVVQWRLAIIEKAGLTLWETESPGQARPGQASLYKPAI